MATDSRFSSFHCATPALSQLEDELQHLCHYGRALILVIGPPGAGRSHLAKRLKATLSNNLPVALINAQPLMTSDQLDQEALRQLGLTQIALVESDLSLAIARAPAGRRTLIVDDAQDLNLPVLRSLLECAVCEREREDPRLTLVLFGDDMLETALAELDYAGLDSQDRHRLQLPPFGPEDAQRLATVWAAADGEPEPDRATVRLIWQQQQGWPGAILNHLAEQAVKPIPDEVPDDETDSFAADVREHGAGDDSDEPASFWQRHSWLKLPLIGVGVFVLALLLMYQRELNDWLQGGQPPAAAAVKPAQDGVLADARRQDLAIDAQPVTAEQEPAGLEIIEESTTAMADSTTDSNAVSGAEQAATADYASAEPMAVDNKPLAVISETASGKAPVAASVPTSPPPSTASVSRPAVDKPAASASRYSADEQALLNASPGYFAVQIIGLRDDDAMNKYIRQHKLDRGLVYHGIKNGAPWQVLVLAPFADRAAAERARDGLPEAVRKGGPWIKSIKAIQDEIKASKR